MRHMTDSIVIVVQYYHIRNESADYRMRRQREIDDCLVRNSMNTSVDAIHVLVEEDFDFGFIPAEYRSKLHIVNIGKRLTYEFVFDYYNTHIANSICILINADIYTNNTVDVLRHVNFNSVFFAMNRYEHNDRSDLLLLNGLEVNLATRHKCPYLIPYQASVWSQDAWIWKSPNLIVRNCGFELGTPGCDNHIIYQLLAQNFIVCNPSRLICMNHIDRLSIQHESYGIVKGIVSKKREQRIGDMKTYTFVENLDDIPDKYTTNIDIITHPKYSFMKGIKFTKIITEIQPDLCTVTASSTHDCVPTDIFFRPNAHWEPLTTDRDPYVEFNFTENQTIVIIDILGKLTLRNDATVGYVSVFHAEWMSPFKCLKSETYKGISVPNGNVIQRIYLETPIVTTSLRIYPLEYVGVRAMKLRMFTQEG